MTREIVIRRLAEQHLAEAYAWYAKQAPSLGVDFLDRFDEVLKQIAAFPEASPVVLLDYRRTLLRRFPYGVFYVIEGECVVVAAVYHLARNPQTIRATLQP